MNDRRVYVRSWACAILTLVSSVGALHAQERPLRTPPEFAIDQWTTEHGLPQNSVNAIVQAPDGYLWIGTFGGLALFDGSSFTLMERSDSAGRHIDRVLSLALGPDSALWIGTEAGLLRRKDGVYRSFAGAAGLPDDEIRTLYVDRKGTLWIGTGTDGLAWYTGDEFRSLREVDGTPLGYVTSIREDAAGTLWIGAAGGKMLTMAAGDIEAASWQHMLGTDSVEMMLHDRNGAHWFSLPSGMARSSDGDVRRFDVPGGSAMVEDPVGGYWVGTINDGVLFFNVDADTAVIQRYPLPDGRLGFRVHAAYVDDEGNVWLGTNAAGLLRARRNLFTTYTSEHGLSHDVATAVFEDRSGTMWVGTNCGGVNAIDPDRRSVRILNPRSPGDPEGDPCVFAIGESAAGTVWQGSYGGGVSELTNIGVAGGDLAGLRDSVVLALYTARNGTMWVGTRTGGIAAVEDGRVRATWTVEDGLADNSIRTIHETRDGTIWIGTIAGLSRFSDGRFVNYTAADGMSSEHVRSIYEDSDGTLWIGTYGGGLNRFRNGEFRSITLQDGLADDVVSAILEDDAGNFWMSGNRGIYRVARSQLDAFADGRIDRVHSVLYGRADGLVNPETNGGFHPAGWKDSRGRLWFPTVEGVAVVDPARVVPDDRVLTVALEGVVVDGVARPLEDEMVVGPGRPNVEFRYTGLSLSAPEHVHFRYRLDGYDEEWVDAGPRRIAYYPRLPAGNYTFTVSAANRDGVWTETASVIRLRVVPPFWSAYWFRLGLLIAVIGVIVLVVRRREAVVREDRAAKDEFARRLIESQENERRRLAGELHDGLGQELLIVRNRALLGLRDHAAGDDMRDQLRQIASVVTGSLGSIRELAHNLAPHQLDHLGISSALRTMIETVAEASGIELSATIEELDGLLPIEREINLYRIVQEGINNVVRHSGTRAAAIHVWRDGPVIRATIIDQGRGFLMQRDSRGRPTGGFGLTGMTQRARILGGSLDLWSAPGRGVRLALAIPIAHEATPDAATGAAIGGET